MDNIKTSLSNNRLDYLDATKGIATLFVLIFHTIPEELRTSSCFAVFMLPIFFLISGILLAYKPSFISISYIENVKKKFLSLMYPYLTFSILSMLVLAIVKVLIFRKNDFSVLLHVFRETITLLGYNTLWYFPTLFFSEIIFIFFEKKQINRWIVLLTTITISSIISLFASELTGVIYNILIFISRALIGLSFIYIGYIIYPLINKLPTNKRFVFSSASLIILTLASLPFHFYPVIDIRTTNIHNPILFFPCATITSLALIIFCKYALANCKIISYIGKNSLIIFATHYSCEITSLAWIIVSIVNKIFHLLTSYSLNDRMKCIFVFVITTLIELLIIVPLINKYFKIILRLPIKNKKN